MSNHDSPIFRAIFFVCCHDFGLLRIRRLQNCRMADIYIIFLSTENLASCWTLALAAGSRGYDWQYWGRKIDDFSRCDDYDDFFGSCHDFGLRRIWRLQNCWIADIVIIYLSTEKMDDDSSSDSPSYLSLFFTRRQGAGVDCWHCHHLYVRWMIGWW